MSNATRNITLTVPPFFFMLTACRSNFFWSISIEMGLHLSVRTEACQSKRWLWAPICVHGRIDLPSENSSRQQIPTSQTDKRLSFLKWFPRRPVKLSIWKIVYIGSSLWWSLNCLTNVCYLSFFPRGKNKRCAADFFSCLSRGRKKCFCGQNLIQMYLPCLAANQILVYLSKCNFCALCTPNAYDAQCRVWRTKKLTEDDVSLKANLTQTYASNFL